MSRHTKSYLKGVLYGSLIGVGLALIYSPRKGEQSQALIREVAEETRQRAEDFSQTVTEQSNEWSKLAVDLYSQGKAMVEEMIDRIREGVNTQQ